MFRPVALYIGLRYTRAKRRNHFISFIALTSMLGLMLGVAVLITVLSVMNGFGRELQVRILGMVPHGAVIGYKYFSDWQDVSKQIQLNPEVQATAPFIHIQGMMSNKGEVVPVLVSGVQPELEGKVSIVTGEGLGLSRVTNFSPANLSELVPGEYDVILGRRLARKLGVAIGDKVTFLMPEATISPAGVMPRYKRFTVTGTFQVGAEMDGLLAMIHIEDAQKLIHAPGAVEGVRIKYKDLFEAPKQTWKIVEKLDPDRFQPSDWTRTHGSLFEAIKMEKTMMAFLLLLIVAVAAFNIVSSLVMLVTDKRADIAILRTLGATPRTIMTIFMVQGTIIGCFGTLTGILLGLLVAYNVTDFVEWLKNTTNHDFMQAYFIDYLPSEVHWQDITLVSVAAFTLSFLATIYPAFKAARTEPAEALRYD
ncbi:MAG TPA: lipoprotein-releasing ABC transporter permease subunit [Pseudomonadales bacterium]|nr:lipoprotein-releasing ABC transporter permease subunit [Pseudomonadales bacterium]